MKLIAVLILIVFGVSFSALAGSKSFAPEEIERLFSAQAPLLQSKLTIDALVSAGVVDVDVGTRYQSLKSAWLKHAEGATSSHEKLARLREFYFQSGPWNGAKPFAYDRNDPLGRDPNNRKLAVYLEDRLGNCVTMPVLFVVLGREVGLQLDFALAPQHMFVIYTDDQGRGFNLETTSGAGFTRAAYYREQLPMTDQAVENGVYLRKLNHTQTIAALASDVVSHHLKANQPEQAIAVADVILQHDPSNVVVMVQRGSAFALILQRDILSKYTKASQMTPEQLAYAEHLSRQNGAAFERAESLGWRQSDGQKQ